MPQAMRSPPITSPPPQDSGLSTVVHRNIRELMKIRQHQEANKTLSNRVADSVTRFAGSMTFVIIHAVWFGGWLLFNSPGFAHRFPFVKAWDPFPFVMLAMIASVEAIFLSTFILISQNRMQQMADRRAELDLQISLLTEHELTRAIQLIDSVAQTLSAPRPQDHEFNEIKKDVRPERVLEEIERAERSTGGPHPGAP